MATPLAAYVPARRHGDLIYVSGQLPMKKGGLMMSGPMAAERSLDEAQQAMEQCFLNALAACASLVDLEKIQGVLKLTAFVASEIEYTDQHRVANGASGLAEDIFGEAGKHARSAVGGAALPLGATVELEVIFLIAD